MADHQETLTPRADIPSIADKPQFNASHPLAIKLNED